MKGAIRPPRLEPQADDGLVQQDLVEDGTEHVAVAGIGHRDFHCLGDRAAKGAGRSGMLGQDLAADIRRIGRGRRDRRAVCAHDFAPEGLLLVADLDHIYLAVEAKIGTSHRKRRAPLACSGLSGHAFKPLFFGVVGLRDGGVELVAAARVVALELVVDVRGGPELLFEAVRADERRGAVHLVEILNLLRDRDISVLVVQFLGDQLLAEDAAELFGCHGLMCAGIEKGSGLVLHVRPDVIPGGRDLVLGKIDLVRDLGGGLSSFCCLVGCIFDFVVCHGSAPFAMDVYGLSAMSGCMLGTRLAA